METRSETRSIAPMDLMTTLRRETQDLHTRIESRLDFSVHFASRTSYRQLLARYYGFYQPFEAWLFAPERAAPWAALEIDPSERRKAEWLRHDLCALGMDAEQIAHLPLCPPGALPQPASPGALLGCAYVLEGATLGGQVIGRYLEKSLGLTVGAPGARFFFGYGTETGIRWKQFRRAAEAFVENENVTCPGGEETVQEAVAFARQTFLALESHVFSTAL